MEDVRNALSGYYTDRFNRLNTNDGKAKLRLHWHLPSARDTVSDNKARVLETDPRTEAPSRVRRKRVRHVADSPRKATCVFTASQNASGPCQVHLESNRPTSAQGHKEPKTAT